MASRNRSVDPKETTIGPPISIDVHIGLAAMFTSLYGLLFLLIVWQLFAILYYRHRKISYQTVFLFVCLLWAGLRTTLFSFYFQNCDLSNDLPTFCSWLLFAFPVFLQFLMLSILVFYFVLVVIKITSPSKPKKYRKRIFTVLITTNTIFLTTDLISSVLYCHEPKAHYQQTITIVRVILDYSSFMAAAIVLCFCIIKLSKTNSAKVFLEGQGISFCQAVTICGIISLLYISRAMYNILAVSSIEVPSFGFGWINVSDQGEIIDSHGNIKHTTKDQAFISFGTVLVIWELIPTFITVWFFRVRSPLRGSALSSMKSDSFNSRSYFFDNPNRYDSDDDLSIAYNTPPRLLDIPNRGSRHQMDRNSAETSHFYKKVTNYGSVPTYGSYITSKSGSYHSPLVRGITPPLLYQGSGPAVYQPVSEET